MKWQLFILPLLVSFSTSSAYYLAMDMPMPNVLFGIAFHVLIMLWLLSGLMVVFALLEWLLKRAALKTRGLIFAGLSWFFLFVYLFVFSFNAFGRHEWGHLVPVSLMLEITRQLPAFIQSSPVQVGPYIWAGAVFLLLMGLYLIYRASAFYRGLQYWLNKKKYLLAFFIGVAVALVPVGKLYLREMPFQKSLTRLVFNYTKVHDPIASLVFRIIRGKEYVEENEVMHYNFQTWDTAAVPGLQPHKNVVLIIVDALRADHLPLYGYDRPVTPFLDSLYRTGHLRKIRYATSACNSSFCGIMNIVKSIKWQDQGPYDFGLPDLLKQYNYQINFLLSGPHRNWYELGKRYGRDIDFLFEGNDSGAYGFTDDRLI
ncbi:MAG: sulfatase-like hydrolase/transferase, partial [Sinomicrobium sp.]|nr:sulfatase-like hydrolase/transferase [Sinomicrobium sp.]